MAATTDEIERCPRCHRPLPATGCPVCIELGHITWLLREAALWPSTGLADRDTLHRLQQAYARLRHDLLVRESADLSFDVAPPPPTPAPTPPAAAPSPMPEPEPAPAKPRQPSEWDRLVAAGGQLAWLYAVGGLFIAGALGWLVIASFGTPLGRWVLAATVGGVSAALLGAGRFVRERLRLETGAEALQAVGTLLLPAALYALRAALGVGGGDSAHLLIWAVAAAFAVVVAHRHKLVSHLVLANLFAVPAALVAAHLLLPAAGSASTLALFVPLLAGANTAYAWRMRHQAEAAGPRGSMLRAARVSAALLAGLASLLLLAGVGGLLEPGFNPGLLFGALMLGGALVAMAFETDRPALIGLAAAAWYLFGLAVAGIAGFGATGDALAVLLLLAAGALARERERHLAWCFAAASVICVWLVARWMPAYAARAVDPATAVSAWLLVAVYSGMAFLWRRRRLLSGAVVLGTAATVFTSVACGEPLAHDAGWLAGFAAVVMAAGRALRGTHWEDRQVSGPLAEVSLVPQIAGLAAGLAGWALGSEPAFQAVSFAALLALSFVLSFQVGRREILYLTVLQGAAMAFCYGEVLPYDVDVPLALAACGVILTAVALATWDHFQPFEISAVVLLLVAGALAYGEALWNDPAANDAGALLLVVLGFGLPTIPRFERRSLVPELAEVGFRPWATLIAGALLGSVLSATAGEGWCLGGAAAALAYRLAAFAVPTGAWAQPLRWAAVGVAGISGFGCLEGQLWSLYLAQVTLLLSAEGQPAAALVAFGQWLCGLFIRENPGLSAPLALSDWALAGLDFCLALGYLAGARRDPVAPVLGAVILAAAHGYLADALAVTSLPLWFGLYVVVVVGLAIGARTLGLKGVGGLAAVAGLAAFATVVGAIADERVLDANILLYGYTVLCFALGWKLGWDIRAPLALLNVAVAYTAWSCWVPPDGLGTPSYGFRLALLVLVNVLAASGLRGRERWFEAVLQCAAGVAVVAVPLLLAPPERASVFGFVVLSGASLTAAWMVRAAALWDLGFGCAWLAGAMILYDAARNGRGELFWYRSLDLYAVPIAVYLLAVVERRADEPRQVRCAALLLGLGGLLISAFAADSGWHDAALFASIAAVAVWGNERSDRTAVQLAIGTFGLYVLGFVWQYKAASRWLLVPVLLILGGAVIAYALRREREERGEPSAS